MANFKSGYFCGKAFDQLRVCKPKNLYISFLGKVMAIKVHLLLMVYLMNILPAITHNLSKIKQKHLKKHSL